MIARRLALGCAALALLVPASAHAAQSGPTSITTKQPVAVACPSETLCVAVAVDDPATASDVVTFDPRTGRGVRATPLATIGGGALVNDVSCPSSSQCTTVDRYGVASTFDPADPGNAKTERVIEAGELTAVACPSTTQCTAVEATRAGAPGRRVTFDPTSPTLTQPVVVDPDGTLLDVDCPTASQCTATDGTGHVVTFDPRSTAPVASPVKLSGNALPRIACAGPTQCSVIDGPPLGQPGSVVTFNPQAPPSAPDPAVLADRGVTSLACPAARLCAGTIGLGQAIGFDPQNAVRPKPRLLFSPPDRELGRDVSCPSIDQCTAVGYDGTQVTFDPVPVAATPSRLRVRRNTNVVAVVVLPNAKAGTKVTAELRRGTRRLKRTRLTLGTDRSASFRIGRLRRGRYVASFRVGATKVKTIRIIVR